MTTRDPRDPRFGHAREPTQPLSLDGSAHEAHDASEAGDASAHESSLALGTANDERTKVESPSARLPKSRPQPALAKKKSPRDEVEDPAARLGEVLGAYRLLDVLGKGGMGFVYRAEHVKLGREVALKLLRADYARRRESVIRFFQEAKTVNRVRHRNIVDVTDFVELDDGTTYIIMELLRGQSLGKWARTGIDLPRALGVLVQICDGLGAAHAVGVIHRDLKPDNVVVTPVGDGSELVKLLDFGVAKLVNRDDEDLGFQTAAGSVIGTPAYMSPEQAGGMAVDPRSDIYSLGAIMYELFCGVPPFRGRSFGEYVRKHLTEQPVLPHLTPGGENVPEALEALIMRCLAKEPDHRFGHILELRDGILRLIGGAESHAIAMAATIPSGQQAQLPRAVLPLAPPMHTAMPTPPAQLSQLSGRTSGHHGHSKTYVPPQPSVWPWLAAGASAVAVGIAAAVWYANRADANAPVPAQPPPAVATQPTTPTAPVPAPTTATPPATPPVVASVPLVELRFDSIPSGGVFAAGHTAELCRTPCAFNVDLRDGESQTKRTFVVRSDGYVDGTVDVDLTAAQREFRVRLDRIAPHRGRPTAKHSPEPVVKDEPKVEAPVPAGIAPAAQPQPPAKDTLIDPTDTHDPFKHH